MPVSWSLAPSPPLPRSQVLTEAWADRDSGAMAERRAMFTHPLANHMPKALSLFEKGPSALVAGEDLNLRPLGYEPYDARLPRLGLSPVTTLTSADLHSEVFCGLQRLPRFSLSRCVPFTNRFTEQAIDLQFPVPPGLPWLPSLDARRRTSARIDAESPDGSPGASIVRCRVPRDNYPGDQRAQLPRTGEVRLACEHAARPGFFGPGPMPRAWPRAINSRPPVRAA
jgi:hypothetical protein